MSPPGAAEARLVAPCPLVDPVAPRPLADSATLRPLADQISPRPLSGDDIAVVGMAGRFAGAADLGAFRRAALAGLSLLGPASAGRFRWILPPRGAMAQVRGGFLADVDRFDAALFGVGDREAARMDPQSRLLLEACRAALEDAGHAPGGLAGRCVGVFVAHTFQEWLHRLRQPAHAGRLRLTDMTVSVLASRVSRAFDLRGSSEVLNAACSGGLLAVHRACMALRAGECEAALAGGVSLILAGDGYVGEARAGMLCADGGAPAFDEAGRGFLRGEGVGVLLLKTLARARADRDDVRVVIRGSAAGHGGAAGGYDAGAAASQADAVERALRAAGVDPAAIGYLELQAAGRPAEEAAELAVIAAGFRRCLPAAAPLPAPFAGALKPVTGHLEAVSGLAQIVKAAAVLGEGVVPPIGGLARPAAAVQAAWPGLGLPVEAGVWAAQEAPRRALVSGFGFGGSHAHLVLEAAPREAAAASPPQLRAYLLSAATPALLAEAAGSLAAALRREAASAPEDVAFTLLVGRDTMPERLAVLADDPGELTAQLAAFAAAPERRGAWLRGSVAGRPPVLGEAAEDRDWLCGLVLRGEWPKLAALWCNGLGIDWAALGDVLPGRRVALPPMPLAATRFWLEDETAPAAIPAPPAAPVAPPGPGRAVMLDLLAETLGAADGAAWSDGDSPAALGLDSMAAAELRGRIAERCGGAAPSLAALLQAPDLRSLTALLPPLAEGPEMAALVPDPAARHAPFPTTDIQFAYLVGRQDGQRHGGFGAQVYWEFDRPRFDVGRLTAAWNRLVVRHGMLRAVFAPDATQRVLPPAEAGPVEIPLHDWSAAAAGEAARQREALAGDFRDRNFDPARFPLFRLAVTRDAAGDRLHFALDLLLADGPSLFLLLEELAALYEAPEQEPAPLGLGFRDYVLHQKRREAASLAADTAYWEARLDDLPGPPALPMLPGTPDRADFLRHAALLPLPLWRRFGDAAAAHGLTASGALMAAFADSLAAWAEQPEFCLNVTLAGRHPAHPDVFRLVGDFTGNVLLAVPARGGRGFAGHAAALAAQLAADIEHAGCSAVRVLGMLGRRRRAPVAMPVVFTAVHGYGALLKRPVRIDAIGAYRGGATRTPQVWLDAQALEAAAGLHLSWDAQAGLFAPDLLADMFAGFVARVRRLAEQPEAWTEASPALVAPAVSRAANATAARLPWEPIFAGILRQAEAAPDREAVVAEDRRLDFGTLVAEATALAGHIRAAGVAPGRLVAVVMPKGWRQVVAVLAIGLAGAAYVPLELPLPPARIGALLARAGVALALAHDAPPGLDWPCAAADVDALLASPPPPDPALPPVAADDLAYVMFTSGSTGEPKGVALRHGAVSNTLHDVNGRFAVGPGDRVLGVSSLGFDLSVWDVFGVLGAGGALVLPAAASVRDPAHLAALMAREGVTLWNSTPAYLKLLLEAPGAAPPASLRLVLLSGDWLPLPLARRLRAEHPAARLVSLGGATEAAIWSICQPVDRVEEGWRSVLYGRPLANQRFHVLDDALQPCPVGEAGQLHIGGTGLAEGYWQDEARSAEGFIRHPETGERLYRTGDYGRILPDGGIEFLGRRDAQVKIGGHRIELAEVEAGLQAVPGVLEAVAFPLDDSAGNRRLAAAYRHDPGTGEGAVRAALAASLPAYLVPGLLLPLERMPLTTNGKLDRQALAALALAGLGAARPSPAADPGAAVAAMLGAADVIADVAGRARFAAGAPAVRRDLAALPSEALAPPPDAAPPARVSTRRFLPGPVTRGQLAALLAPLREVATAQRPRRRYGSAGSSYAVQLYLLVRAGGCDGLAAGLWHHLPGSHRLAHLGEMPVPPGALHAPVNRAMAEAAAVSLLLVGDLAAIRPLYGGMAEDLLRIEAGAMAQLLAEEAAVQGLGLCGIGWLDLAPLRAGLRLSPDHVFLHAMVGGRPAAAEPTPAGARARPLAPACLVAPDRWVALVRREWAEVLGHADFADDANFFEVGGNSFLAVALQAGLQARLAGLSRPPPSVTELFRHPTVLALAARLAAPDDPLPATARPVPAPDSQAAADPAGARRARRQAARRLVAAGEPMSSTMMPAR